MVRLATEFGDAALLLPASAILFAYLAYAKSLRAAIDWAAVLMLCVGFTIVAKVIFHACGAQLESFSIHSPSGHVSLSTTFYGAAFLIFSPARGRPLRLLMLLGCAALIFAIAASRVILHTHSVTEVAAGFLIGVLSLLFYAARTLPRLVPPPGWQIPVVVLVVLTFFAHGRHLSLEGVLDRLTDHVELSQHLCPLNDGDTEQTVETGAALGS